MMVSMGLIALGYIIAACGVHYPLILTFGILIMLAGWFSFLRTGLKDMFRQGKKYSSIS